MHFFLRNTGEGFCDFGSGNGFPLHLVAAHFPQVEIAVGVELLMGAQSSWHNLVEVKRRAANKDVNATGNCAVITINGSVTNCRSLSRRITDGYCFVGHPLMAKMTVYLCSISQFFRTLRIVVPQRDVLEGM